MREAMRRTVRSLFLVALLAATPAVGAAAAEPDPAAVYQRACAECHRNPSRVVRGYLERPQAERAPALDRFLAGHYAPDARERAALVAWLLAGAGGR